MTGGRPVRAHRRQGDAGFSLAEALIALLLTALVIGAAAQLFDAGATLGRVQPELVDMQQRARVAQDVLFRDLLSAGAGPSGGPLAGPLVDRFAPILPRRVGLRNPDAFDVARPDAVSMLTVTPDDRHAVLRTSLTGGVLDVEPMPGCDATSPVCGVSAGQTMAVFDAVGRFDLFALTAVSSGVATLEPLSGGSAGAYQAGDVASVAEVHTYYFDAAAHQLRYYDGRFTDVAVVDDVVDVAFEYVGDPAPPGRPKPPAGTANCLYDAAGGRVPGPSTLPSSGGSLAPLPLELFRDGPWCGVGAWRYDADLLRVRQIRVRVRVQASAPALRAAGPAYAVSGTSTDARRSLPDYTVRFDVAPRNLNLDR